MSSNEDIEYIETRETVISSSGDIIFTDTVSGIYADDTKTNIVLASGTDENGIPIVVYLPKTVTSIGEVIIEVPPIPIIIEPKLNLPDASALIATTPDGRLTLKNITVSWYPSDNAFSYQVFFIYNNPNIVLLPTLSEKNEFDIQSYSASTFFSEQSGILDKYTSSYNLVLPGPILNREDPVYNRINAFVYAYDFDKVRSDFPSFMMTFLINSPKNGTSINQIIIENTSYGNLGDGNGYSTNIVDETPNYGGADQNIYTKNIV